MAYIMEVKGLSITHLQTKKPIVKNVSFGIEQGKVLGIIGESGSGKTLTCKAIMQILNHKTFDVRGAVMFAGENMMTMGKKKVKNIVGKDLSMIMQNPMTAFDPMMTIGYQMIETIRAHTHLSKKQAYDLGIKSLQSMNLPRVSQIMHSYPHTLSGGMLQRVMIALSLMLEPKVIIADEATTALDVKTQAIIIKEFEKLRDSGIAMIVVSHDFGVIAQIADHIIVMKDGEVIEAGTSYQMFYNPSAPYTKELLEARLLTEEVNYA